MQIIQTVCDKCYARQELVDAAEKPTELAVDKKRMLVDLCAGCRKELDERVAEFFAVARRPEATASVPARKPPVTGPRAVPDLEPTAAACSCGRTFTTARGLSRHLHFPGELGAGQEHAAA